MSANDLISLYCLGDTKEAEAPCEQLLPPEICRLLRDEVLHVIFDQGRCRPTVLLQTTVTGQLKRYRDLFSPDPPEDYAASLTFELVKQLEYQHLTNHPTLPALKSYFNVAGARAVVALLEELNLLVPRTCGNCIHLSLSKPYLCEHPDLPWRGKTRIPSKKACQQGFEAYTLEPLTSTTPLPPTKPKIPVIAAIELENLLLLLAERAEQEEGTKSKQRYERQFTIFSAFSHLIVQGYTRKEAVDEILRLLNINARTLRKDLHEIKEFFVKKKVL